ncbi:NFIX isoform 7 [Pan troglodytes]|uniref:Nuclear factor I X n=2 Tax=Homininae TaxID=207598 RepID=K7EPU2_HUMAN|nr:nuclear factor I X [Homo sapiens]KAI4040786.1 nuclear factor I X [Homo sapiens]PNI51137.1 NFIX isoform 7 [Pan troglodytes]
MGATEPGGDTSSVMSSTRSSRHCCLTSALSPTPGSTCRRGSASTSRSMKSGCRRTRSGR